MNVVMLPRYREGLFTLGVMLAAICAGAGLPFRGGTATAVSAADIASFPGKVVGIQGGDTITVLEADGEKRIGLCGVDGPERHQVFGSRARRVTADLALGNTVTMHVRELDRHRRTIGETILLGAARNTAI
jgi:endonuclease YncB( thermonuclease family)